MVCGGLSNADGRFRPVQTRAAIAISESGLEFDGGAVLVRVRKSTEGRPELATAMDCPRMLAILSVAYNRSVSANEVMPHVDAAAGLWRRGDKALANLRLVFSGLNRPDDATAGDRAVLAAHLLDQGWTPATLLEDLGFAPDDAHLDKYNPRHVPAGNGRRGGQFDFKAGQSDGRIIVAGNESDEQYEAEHPFGGGDPKERAQHHQAPFDLAPPIPVLGGPLFSQGAPAAVSAALRATSDKVGSGKGPVYGTQLHTELKNQINQSGRDDLHSEQSYLNQKNVPYGTPGSVRIDVIEGSKDQPIRAYDLKSGGATLTPSRVKQLQYHLPRLRDGTEVNIYEVRP